MTDKQQRCPVHGRDEPGWEWPCPVASEGDPPGSETCPHFVAEIERRTEDIRDGNYISGWRDDDGNWWSQEYRNHQPHTDTEPWTLGRP